MSALTDLVQWAKKNDDESIRLLGEQAAKDVYTIAEFHSPSEMDCYKKLVKTITDLVYSDSGAHHTGWLLMTEELDVNEASSSVNCRFGGSFLRPHTRIGALQMVTSRQMEEHMP